MPVERVFQRSEVPARHHRRYPVATCRPGNAAFLDRGHEDGQADESVHFVYSRYALYGLIRGFSRQKID